MVRSNSSSALMRIVRPCWRPSPSDDDSGADSDGSSRSAGGRSDGLLWFKDLARHSAGEFSFAVVQANALLEDGSQLESGPLAGGAAADTPAWGTFVGVYDGHGGPETARYVTDHLFRNLKKFAAEEQGMSEDVIRKAYSSTEEGFLSLVRKQWLSMPQIASVGACCLVSVVCNGILYTANAGDSRAVLGKWVKGEGGIMVEQLTVEHNANYESVRNDLRSLHPDDPQIVVMKHKVWRVKGLIQISRSIGDAYLKDAEFNKEPLIARFRLPEPFDKPILSAEPTIDTRKLTPQDKFVILASDGLWEHLSNEQAADIVHTSPRHGIARRLIRAALREAAKKREMRYSDLKKIDRGIRRHFHDDITVVVLFLDHVLISKSSHQGPVVSVRGGGAASLPTDILRKSYSFA